jgi:hypothetical protein
LDENGELRAGLGVGEKASGLTLYDENGKLRAKFSVDKDGSLFGLYNGEDEPKAVLILVNGEGYIDLYDSFGKLKFSK